MGDPMSCLCRPNAGAPDSLMLQWLPDGSLLFVSAVVLAHV